MNRYILSENEMLLYYEVIKCIYRVWDAILSIWMLWIISKSRILFIVSSKTAALIWYFEHFAPCIRSRFIDTGLDQRYDIILPNQIWFYNSPCTIFRDIYRVVVLINHYHIHQSHTHGQKHKHIYEYRNVNCAFLLVMSNDT